MTHRSLFFSFGSGLKKVHLKNFQWLSRFFLLALYNKTIKRSGIFKYVKPRQCSYLIYGHKNLGFSLQKNICRDQRIRLKLFSVIKKVSFGWYGWYTFILTCASKEKCVFSKHLEGGVSVIVWDTFNLRDKLIPAFLAK